MDLLIIYLVLVNTLAVLFTVRDKLAAKRHARRTPEFTLMLISAFGGAPAMYVTMLIIRHKTRKPLFMIGIPAIFILEIAAVWMLLRYVFYVV